ncbi:MAG: hypothetical protein KYQ20_00045 [Candidatus Nealsonbacteria bacterium]|nr:hypothetical protein [Candidatus Nealsonbacteria bacterium]
MQLERYKNNPILEPRKEHAWETGGVFNPSVIYEQGKVYIVYRAFSKDHTSSLGLAISKDGFNIDERLPEPIYKPRESFEKKAKPGVWSGCEDPRITKIGDRFYMCYTAFDGVHPTRVALTSIKVKDFLAFRWKWEKPVLISPPGIDDKNACILPQKIKGKYFIFHRFHPCIWIDSVKDLNFKKDTWIKGSCWFMPRTDKWDSRKIGIGPVPIKTKQGWLLIYHGLSEQDRKYRLGAMLLDLKDPSRVLCRPNNFILEPQQDYEKQGVVPNVVFTNGAIIIKDQLFIYYGAADNVIGLATVNLNEFLKELTEKADYKIELIRHKRNPILKPNIKNWWEADAVFNPCVIKDEKNIFHMVYRAHSSQFFDEHKPGFHISFLGYANSKNGSTFKNRRLFFKPEHKWEYFGCEDPRITKFGNQYFIFYTAVSHFPSSQEYVKIALATTKDFKTITKHGIVTPFNAKCMVLFPERINGKMVAIFALEPDLRPLKTGIAFFNDIQEILSQEYWDKWWIEKDQQGKNILFPPTPDLEIEVGAPPIKTKQGWLLILAYITGISLPGPDVFGIGAALLDLKDPTKILAKSDYPFLIPKTQYEIRYMRPNAIIFPSGAVVKNKELLVYYGAGDKICCLAFYNLERLIKILLKSSSRAYSSKFAVFQTTKGFGNEEF